MVFIGIILIPYSNFIIIILILTDDYIDSLSAFLIFFQEFGIFLGLQICIFNFSAPTVEFNHNAIWSIYSAH